MLEKALRKFRPKVFLLLCAATVFLTACYPVTRSSGVVKDSRGQPVAGATVKIGGRSAKPGELKTNADGTFNFGEIQITSHENPVEIEMFVEKEGFTSVTRKLAFNEANTDEIVLQK